MNKSKLVHAIIITAGKSERMGQPKAFLKVSPTKTFLEKVIDEYHLAGIHNLVIVTNWELINQINVLISNIIPSVKCVVNPNPEQGRLSSIQTGLNVMDSDFCFIQNIDNPFISSVWINSMLQMLENSRNVLPFFNQQGGHPVLISKPTIDFIKNYSGIDLKLSDVLRQFPFIKWQCSDKNILCNMNTLQQYSLFLENNSVL